MQQQSHKRKLILASTSPYRKLLLERLAIPFEICAPDVDETPLTDEPVAFLVARLANEKAEAVGRQFPEAIIIGSDQMAVHGGSAVGKPGSAEKAVEQLQRFSGQTIHFLTAVSVIGVKPGFRYERTVVTDVCFRDLSNEEIQRYVEREQPLDCAGSFKSEAGGIGLMNAIRSDDSTAIVGLPLISVAEALRRAGYQVP